MFRELIRKIHFFLIPTQKGRTNYIYKHRDLFHHVGEKLMWQSRHFPHEPQLISLGNNCLISSDVTFINHDMIHQLLNNKYSTKEYKFNRGIIEIGDNVLIGSRVYILPNVKIGNDVVIGAGSIVTKDIPSNSVGGGVPFKIFNTFDDLAEKRKFIKYFEDLDQYWE